MHQQSLCVYVRTLKIVNIKTSEMDHYHIAPLAYVCAQLIMRVHIFHHSVGIEDMYTEKASWLWMISPIPVVNNYQLCSEAIWEAKNKNNLIFSGRLYVF